MAMRRLIRVTLITAAALFCMTGSASASTIIYDTADSPLTMFTTGGLVLDSTGGATATLTYVPLPDTTVGTPSNISLGDFDSGMPIMRDSGLGSWDSFRGVHV